MRERDPEGRFAYNIKRWYGITLDEYNSLLKEQGGGCAICHSTEPAGKRVKRFSVDHDHRTGKVRGLLCNLCNHLLGCARDDLQLLVNAVAYLERVA
jgi:hypothetical protein